MVVLSYPGYGVKLSIWAKRKKSVESQECLSYYLAYIRISSVIGTGNSSLNQEYFVSGREHISRARWFFIHQAMSDSMTFYIYRLIIMLKPEKYSCVLFHTWVVSAASGVFLPINHEIHIHDFMVTLD